jgi:hypothetical protein
VIRVITQEMKAQLYSAILANIVPTDPVIQEALESATASQNAQRVLDIDKAMERTQDRWDEFDAKYRERYTDKNGLVDEQSLHGDKVYSLRLAAFEDSMKRYSRLKK